MEVEEMAIESARRLRALADLLDEGKTPAAVVITAGEGQMNAAIIGCLSPEMTVVMLEALSVSQDKLLKHLEEITEQAVAERRDLH